MAGELRLRRPPAPEGEGAAASSSSNGKAGPSSGGEGSGKRDELGWMEWGRGWLAIVGEFFFQRIAASHLANPLELPPLDGVSIIVTGATSGIGLEIARSFLVNPSLLYSPLVAFRALTDGIYSVSQYWDRFSIGNWTLHCADS
jgi:hypothetical protein